MEWVLIGIGGAMGSLARFIIGRAIMSKAKGAFPFGTFVINISGAFLLGLVSALHISQSIYFLLGDGFLGAFTTFSTFMYEGVTLLKDNRQINAIVYIITSLSLGIIGYSLGFFLINLMLRNFN